MRNSLFLLFLFLGQQLFAQTRIDTLLRLNFNEGSFNIQNFPSAPNMYQLQLRSTSSNDDWAIIKNNLSYSYAGIMTNHVAKGSLPFKVRFDIDTKETYDSIKTAFHTVNNGFAHYMRGVSYQQTKNFGRKRYFVTGMVQPVLLWSLGFGGGKLCTNCGKGIYEATAYANVDYELKGFKLISATVYEYDSTINAFMFKENVSDFRGINYQVSIQEGQSLVSFHPAFASFCNQYIQTNMTTLEQDMAFSPHIILYRNDVDYIIGMRELAVQGYKEGVLTDLATTPVLPEEQAEPIFRYDLQGRELAKEKPLSGLVIEVYANGQHQLKSYTE